MKIARKEEKLLAILLIVGIGLAVVALVGIGWLVYWLFTVI